MLGVLPHTRTCWVQKGGGDRGGFYKFI